METTNTSIFAKTAYFFISIYALFFTIYIGQDIILPIVYSIIIAILFSPFVNFLTRKKVNKTLAILIAVLLFFIFIAVAIYLLSTQVSMFAETYPQLKAKLEILTTQGKDWVCKHFNIKPEKVNGLLKNSSSKFFDDAASVAGGTLLSISSTFFVIFLLPVYMFMILFYKELLLSFIQKIFKSEHHLLVADVMIKIKKIIQSYLTGLLIEALIIAILNSLGLLILGVDYAIILGVTGALLNIIPYIGGVVAIALPMIIAFVTKETITYPLLVMAMYLFIQFIDNNYIVPKVVASRVRLNALVSVIVVLVGGAVWGIPGMFLSIPMTAILKVIFDNIDSLKPWGFLLGDVVPTATKFSFLKKKIANTNPTTGA